MTSHDMTCGKNPNRCRYNITTDEFDNYGTDHRHNYDIGTGVVSPVEQDPYIDVGMFTEVERR